MPLRFRPSSSDRIVLCPGSTQMSEGIPSRSGPAAREGTAAHTLLERSIKERMPPDKWFGETITVEGDRFTVDEDMVDAVHQVFEQIRSRFHGDCRLLSEVFMSAERFDIGQPLFAQLGGTGDIVILNFTLRRITIIDLKYGRGVIVPADAPQFKTYGFLALVNYPIEEGWKDVETVVVQPRLPNEDDRVKSALHSVDDILTWGRQMFVAMRKASEPNPILVPGEKQCMFCPGAKRPCPAVANAAMSVFKSPFKPLADYAMPRTGPMPDVHETPRLVEPATLSGEECAAVLNRVTIYDTWITAVKQRATNLLSVSPQSVPGWMLTSRTGNRQWVDKAKAEEELLKTGILRYELYDEPKMLSPAKVEKIIPTQFKGIIEALVIRPEGDKTLVPENSNRTPVKPIFAALPSYSKNP